MIKVILIISYFQIEDLFSTGDYLGWSEVSARQNVMVEDAVRYYIDKKKTSGKAQIFMDGQITK